MEYWQNLLIVLKHLPAWASFIIGFILFMGGATESFLPSRYSRAVPWEATIVLAIGIVLLILGGAGLMTQYG